MKHQPLPVRVAIFGAEPRAARPGKTWGLWPAKHSAAITAAGAEPVRVHLPLDDYSWDDLFDGVHGVVYLAASGRAATRIVSVSGAGPGRCRCWSSTKGCSP